MDKLHMPTLRVLEVFKAIYDNEKGLTLTEISRSTGIAKGTLHPIVATLLEKEYLESNGSFISIGRGAFKLGYSYAHSLSYLYILKPHMREIVTSCDEICQLGILDGEDVLYIEKTEPKQAIRIESSAGKTIAAYATALGKCLLSGLTEKNITILYPEKLFSYTANTVASRTGLLKTLQEVRKKGYAHEIGETNIDIECLAVPIKIENKIQAAISVSLPIFRSTPEKIEHIINVLRFHERAIETEISSLPGGIKLFSD
ncbi:IclR family transcriptional regulator [Pectinatus haikarae]|uniref:DNA-binding IclR family transcriptional regulator n=1 Tax=Pectinatus haikarae TaxID=349096 RepID=A0ABT9Y949_9FIRM|nr:IclR family transcriptional regulator [Pectinatus haikarae]MDQ0204370.1 DNA-binding IclR family transcriptional regulator [Pectinatus haikarae]